MTNVTFWSKSRFAEDTSSIRDVKQPTKVETRVVYESAKPVVFWIFNHRRDKNVDGIFAYGDLLGFDNRRYEIGDPSLLYRASGLVVLNVYMPEIPHYREVISFCVNYGIPLIWYNYTGLLPDTHIWSFCYVMAAEQPLPELWSVLCKVVLG